MTDPRAQRPSPDGDPLWQQDFPINRADELNNSRRQFLKFLGLTSVAFFTGTLATALKAAFESRRTADMPALRIAAVADVPEGGSVNFHYPDESYPALLIDLPGSSSWPTSSVARICSARCSTSTTGSASSAPAMRARSTRPAA